jgi:diguanylate cyclase (GGDEF)-like protein
MFGLGDGRAADETGSFATTADQFRDVGRFGDYVRADLDGLIEDWRELCRWDPELAVDTLPVGAEGFVNALADALDRPQPLGWGVDPAVEEAAEVLLRATMALERGMATVVNAMSARLEQEVFVDVLTELPNRRAFQRDLAKQLAQANRSRHSLALVLIDLDGLKAINDSQGYAAGDARLRMLGAALAAAVRAGDGAYRIGGDEFVALLPDSPPSQVPVILRRAVRLAAPAFSWGVATYPDDGHSGDELLDVAHDDLARRRGRPRSPANGMPELSRREVTS